MALPGGQLHLRPRPPHASKRVTDGQAQSGGKQGGLVEAAFVPAGPVQRHRHGRIGALEHVPSGLRQHGGQPPAQRAPFVVLEGVDDVPQAVVVRTDRAGADDERAAPAAILAEARRMRR
jgi:hypothetical protein